MILTSRTPFRVSFFGGGTDYPEYFNRHRGAVVGMAIDRYVYITVLRLPSVIDYKYRVSYSRLEKVANLNEIEHPVVRAVLDHYGVEDALDISVMADLPARSGLGSSSSFAVGFINLVARMKRLTMTRLDLARSAIFVEQELLSERVGVQDQLHAAFGGINRFDFEDARIRVRPVQMSGACLEHLTRSLVLVYTGQSRYASKVLDEQISATVERKIDSELTELLDLTDAAVDILEGSGPETMLADFGRLMHEGWLIKQKLSSRISNSAIDDLYQAARSAGALGGKLCGAGSGGFLLAVVPPDKRAEFAAALSDISMIEVGIDTVGSTILTG